MLGRIKGKKILRERELLHRQIKKVNSLLKRYDIFFLIGFRFIWGIRIATPLIVGASDIKTERFVILNAIGSILWAVIIGILGYLFGHTLTIILSKIKHLEIEIIGLIVIFGIIIWIIRYYKIRRELNKKAQVLPTTSI